LALREVADNIEEDSRNINVGKHCNIHECILVCISTFSNSIQLLRRGARIANQMNGRLFVLFVAHPHQFLSKAEALHLETCQRLTQEFEGEFIRQESEDVVKAIVQVATSHNITQVVLGETRRSRWHLFVKGSIVQRLMQTLRDVDLHIIATSEPDKLIE
jgi:two-component system sensor histidine kinase KdpD